MRNERAAEQLVGQAGFGVLAEELYCDIADSSATQCTFHLMLYPEKEQAELVISDNDSERFHDLSHVRMAFANKPVLAFCRKTTFTTTKGTVVFGEGAVEELPHRKTNMGTQFWATLYCPAKCYEELLERLRSMSVRPTLRLIVIGEVADCKDRMVYFER